MSHFLNISILKDKSIPNEKIADSTIAKIKLADDVFDEIDTKIENSINALNKSDTAVDGKYISKVSETNGIITITRADFPEASATNKGLVKLVSTYSATGTEAITGAGVKAAIDALDKDNAEVADNYVSAVKQEDGIVTASFKALPVKDIQIDDTTIITAATKIATIPIASKTAYGVVKIDDTLSDTSLNPVQNKVINIFTGKLADITADAAKSDGSSTGTAPTTLAEAINNTALHAGAITLTKDTSGSSNKYKFTQFGSDLATVIDVPKDLTVEISQVIVATGSEIGEETGNPITPPLVAGEKYLKLKFAGSDSVYIATSDLSLSVDTDINSSTTNPVEGKGLYNLIGASNADKTSKIASTISARTSIVSAINEIEANKVEKISLGGEAVEYTASNSKINLPAATDATYGVVKVETILSSTSNNPISNSAVKTALEDKQDIIDADNKLSADFIADGTSSKTFTIAKDTELTTATTNITKLMGADTVIGSVDNKIKVAIESLDIAEGTAIANTSTILNYSETDGKVTITTQDIATMTGATASAVGTKGFVPAPVAGDNTKFLSGDGTWKEAGASAATDTALGTVKLDKNHIYNASTAKTFDAANPTVLTAKAVEESLAVFKADSTASSSFASGVIQDKTSTAQNYGAVFGKTGKAGMMAFVAGGNSNEATGQGSLAYGDGGKAQAYYSLAGGKSSIVASAAQNGVAVGDNIQVNSKSEFGCGQYNFSNAGTAGAISADDNTRFSIGIGDVTNGRKNAMEVMQNGDIYVLGLGNYDGTNAIEDEVMPLQESLAADKISDNDFTIYANRAIISKSFNTTWASIARESYIDDAFSNDVFVWVPEKHDIPVTKSCWVSYTSKETLVCNDIDDEECTWTLYSGIIGPKETIAEFISSHSVVANSGPSYLDTSSIQLNVSGSENRIIRAHGKVLGSSYLIKDRLALESQVVEPSCIRLGANVINADRTFAYANPEDGAWNAFKEQYSGYVFTYNPNSHTWEYGSNNFIRYKNGSWEYNGMAVGSGTWSGPINTDSIASGKFTKNDGATVIKQGKILKKLGLDYHTHVVMLNTQYTIEFRDENATPYTANEIKALLTGDKLKYATIYWFDSGASVGQYLYYSAKIGKTSLSGTTLNVFSLINPSMAALSILNFTSIPTVTDNVID